MWRRNNHGIAHELWLDRTAGGKRAIFINKDLRGRDLTSENLRCAVMINCDLTDVPFMWSDLRYLDAKNCITTGIDTSNADTRFTNLRDTHEET